MKAYKIFSEGGWLAPGGKYRALFDSQGIDDDYNLTRMCRDPSTPTELLDMLANEPLDLSNPASYYLAANPSLSLNKIIQLANHPNPIVRQDVATNPKLPVEYIIALANDPEVCNFALQHPNCPTWLKVASTVEVL